MISGGFQAGGSWAIRFPRPDYLKFFALLKGECWLRLENEDRPIRLREGDVVLLSDSCAFLLAGDLQTEPVNALELFANQPQGYKTAVLGTGKDCIQIGGHVQLDKDSGELLTALLPPVIHIRADSPYAAPMKWLLDQLIREREAERAGYSLVSAQIAQLLFVQIMRIYLETNDELPCGSLRAINDRRLAPAMRLMHDEPGHPWQLNELATACAMSRTGFATHFKAVAGVGPLTYLTQWRMALAKRALREQYVPLEILASDLGYGSESAFSNAFKRSTGMAPTHYRDSIGSSIQCVDMSV